MRKLLVILCVISAVALVAACGGNGGNNGGNNGGSLSAEEFAQRFNEEYPKAVCKSAFQCPDEQNPAFVGLLFGRTISEQDCADQFGGTTDSLIPVDDLESGRIEYDAEAAADCLAEIRQRSSGSACDIAVGATAAPESCLAAASGTLADGETCATDEQCRSGACDASAMPNACTGECAPRADLGEACGDPSTTDGATCDPSLVCVPNDSGGFVCAEQGSLEEGDACVRSISTFTACAGGLLCAGEQGNATCQAVTFAQDGEDCSGDNTFCTSGTVCIDDTCTPPGGEGDSCTATNLECRIEHFCDTDAGECTPTRGAGESCSSDSQCSGDLECSDSSNTCQQPEVCTLDSN